jgi:hypothetical protein
VLLSISTTVTPATDLGFLLHKHPGRLQSFEVSVGTAQVFYPEASADRCTASLLLEVDAIALVRGRQGPSSEGFALGQYVNDRPYAASSMMSMALSKVFRTAMTGRCDSRPELAASTDPTTPNPRTSPAYATATSATSDPWRYANTRSDSKRSTESRAANRCGACTNASSPSSPWSPSPSTRDCKTSSLTPDNRSTIDTWRQRHDPTRRPGRA